MQQTQPLFRLKNFIEKIRANAEKNNGRVEIQTQQGYQFYTTIAEMEEFFSCSVRDRMRIITKILRKAVVKYPTEMGDTSPDSPYRKPYNNNWIAVILGDGYSDRFVIPHRPKIAGISMGERKGRKHIPLPEDMRATSLIANFPGSLKQMNPHKFIRMDKMTILDRLREHWINTETHSQKEQLFGFELEFCTEHTIVKETVTYREGACDMLCCPGEGPEHTKEITRKLPVPRFRDIELIIPGVKFKTDGSVKPTVADAAEATLLAGPNGFRRLDALCREIRKRGGFVNKTCGLHVHLDARDNERRVAGIRASKLYDAIEILKDLVPDSRLKECFCSEKDLHKGVNHYCKVVKPEFNGDRYTAINLDAYKKYRTIEVRMAAGSLNAKKIWHWAKFLLCISNAKNRYTTWEELLKSEFPMYLRIWAVNRANEIRPNEKLRLERMNMIAPNLDAVLSSDPDAMVE